ncbi:MAG: hydrogenase maturation nickel metallochaperone HypA [bacterium]|nr:hydrogenase maturation nickel metallochaperone HypA [bacterium]
MHEYSLIQSLLDVVDAEARSRGATAVHHLRVQVGELSGVETELLASAYELFREHTSCAGADLEIVPVPARWGCPDCGAEIVRGDVLRCAACARPAQLETGDEILLERIEMEVA